VSTLTQQTQNIESVPTYTATNTETYTASSTLQRKIASLVNRLKSDVYVNRDPIDVPQLNEGTLPSPETLRSLRLAAGLTKGEAASIVELAGSASWHQYELGKYSMPADRFDVFANVLRTGKYPYPCFSGGKRSGTWATEEFVVGRFIEKRHPKNKPIPARNALIREWRNALNFTAHELAESSGMDEGRINRISACSTAVRAAELESCIRVGLERIDSLKVADFSDASIDFMLKVLHFTEADAGRNLGLSRYVTQSEANTKAFRKVALREREVQIAEILKLEVKTRDELSVMQRSRAPTAPTP
jgi:transcriptional regulator with XRE-family HTH domain